MVLRSIFLTSKNHTRLINLVGGSAIVSTSQLSSQNQGVDIVPCLVHGGQIGASNQRNKSKGYFKILRQHVRNSC